MARLSLIALLAGSLAFGACSTGGSARHAGSRVRVVAAENFWGSIATQIAGPDAEVTSIIANPAIDPHDYEATPADARLIALADYAIVNGIGYDPWAHQLLDANTDARRVVLDVGKLVGVKVGGNPHQWYSPATVAAVAARVASDLARLDPAHADAYTRRGRAYATTGLAQYHALIAQIRSNYAGTPIGGSESIVAPLVSALGLDLKTPTSFLDAIAEGNEPTAHDTAVVNQQIARREIAVFVYNRQNATPDVKRLVDAARRRGIPVTTVTETMVPAGTTFANWQTTELRALRDALVSARTDGVAA